MQILALLTGEAAQGSAASSITMFLPIILVFVVFYFFLIRPEKKRTKQTNDMRNNLKVGDEIVTIGGIIGKITNIKEDQLTIETGADRNKLRIMRWSVSAPLAKDDAKETEKIEDKKNSEE